MITIWLWPYCSSRAMLYRLGVSVKKNKKQARESLTRQWLSLLISTESTAAIHFFFKVSLSTACLLMCAELNTEAQYVCMHACV